MKDIEGFEGLYAITEGGRVWSHSKYRRQGHFLNGISPSARYAKVTLTKGKKGRSFNIHRLVAVAFLPNPLYLLQVNHKNGNKRDNHVQNLEWCSGPDNIKHGVAMSLFAKGSKNPAHKLLEKDVSNIRAELLKQTATRRLLARRYGVSRRMIWLIETNRYWRHVN